jgi:acetyl-CoA C-acetyltransferase
MDEFGVRSQNLAEKAIADGFWARDITPVTLPDGTVVSKDDGPYAGVTVEGVSNLKPVFRRTAASRRATAARSTTARRRWSSFPTPRRVRHQSARAGPDTAGADRVDRRDGHFAEIMGCGPVEASK